MDVKILIRSNIKIREITIILALFSLFLITVTRYRYQRPQAVPKL